MVENETIRTAEPKRHHQVPQFYLRRFSTPKGKIAVYDRIDQRSFGTSVQKVAVENGFYDFETADGLVSKDAEKALQRTELVAKTALDAIDHRPVDWGGPSDDHRIWLSIHIAVQAVRTREYRQAQEEMDDLWYRMQLDLNLTDDRRFQYLEQLIGHPPDRDDLERAKLISDSIEQFRIKLNRREAIIEMFKESEAVAPFIASRPWTLFVAKNRSFVTSDRPVSLWRPRSEDDRHYGVGINTADAIYFPLDPYKVLVLGTGFEGGWNESIPTTKEIRHVNQEVAHWSQRWVLSHPKHERPLDGLTIPREGPVLHINGIAVRPGANVWNQLRKGFIDRTSLPLIHFGFGVDRYRNFSKNR